MELSKKVFSNRLFMLLGLFFLGGMMQYMVGMFGFETKNFLPSNIKKLPENMEICLSIVSGIGLICGAIFNQYLARIYGLKKVLLLGFFINLLALVFISYVHLGRGPLAIIYIVTFLELFSISFGITLILISIISYIVFEIPEKIGSGLLLLFAFGNIGAYLMLPLITYIFKFYKLSWLMILFFFIITIFSIVIIWNLFTDPPFSKHLKHLRKGTRIFKELHYRLILFLIAGFLFSICENSFTSWGKVHLMHYFDASHSQSIILFFWLIVTLSQLTLSFFILLVNIKKVFFYLVALIALALFLFPHIVNITPIIGIYIIGAIGCSGTFAAMIAGLEKELLYLTKDNPRAYIPYIDITVALMIGVYFIGDKALAIKVEMIKDIYLVKTANFFYVGAIFAVLIFIIMGFLFYTSYVRKVENKKGIHKKS